MFTNGGDVLDFKINYKIMKKKRIGFFKLSHINEETVILNNGRGDFSVLPPVAYNFFFSKRSSQVRDTYCHFRC